MAHHGGRPTPAATPLATPLTLPIPAGPVAAPAGPNNGRSSLPRVHRPVPLPGHGALHAPLHGGGALHAPVHGTPQVPPRPSSAAPPTPPRPHPPPQAAPAARLSPSPPMAELVPVPAEVAEVSLTTPRPDGERRANEYVETPVALALRAGVGAGAAAVSSRCKTAAASPGTARHHHRTRDGGANGHRQSVNLPVRQQPTTFKKEPGLGLGPGCGAGCGAGALPHVPSLSHLTAALAPTAASRGSSILCAECGRCRCASCREPRPLPSRWLCDDACFCSAETTVDYATCLCCVKGLFYHCGSAGDEGGVWCADDPCSCAGGGSAGGAGSRRCARWSCLALASVALPCLLCYWPLRGLVRATELCYARYCDDGCRCERRPAAGGGGGGVAGQRGHGHGANNSTALLTTPEKRLLETD